MSFSFLIYYFYININPPHKLIVNPFLIFLSCTGHGPSGSGGSGGGPSDENPNRPSSSGSNEGGAVGGTFT